MNITVKAGSVLHEDSDLGVLATFEDVALPDIFGEVPGTHSRGEGHRWIQPQIGCREISGESGEKPGPVVGCFREEIVIHV